MTDYYAYDAGLPCRNPNCKSRGKPHPNCQCWAGSQRQPEYAHGGSVCALNLPHEKGCAYYADGGDINVGVPQTPLQQPPVDDLHNTLGMASIHHGLSGILQNVGHPSMADPEKHHAKIEKLNHSNKDPAEALHGHPLVGAIGKTNLKPIMQRLSPAMASQPPNPEGLRAAAEYLDHSIKGEAHLDEQMNKLIGAKGGLGMDSDKKSREALKAHLDSLQEHPEKMLDIGGHLGHYLPDHAAALSAQAATAVNYLNGLKPQTHQLAPLDTPQDLDKAAVAKYDRQLDIAQNPLLVLSHVKDGTLLPSDIMTINTLYPGLHRSMVKKMTETLITAKTEDKEIPYKQRQTISMFLGAPLDYTQTPAAMQSILSSSAPPQSQQKPEGKKNPKATNVELKQINKVDEMGETTLEARQINRNKH